MFHSGDRVIVLNDGLSYPSYSVMAGLFELKKFAYGEMPKVKKEYTYGGSMKHQHMNDMVACIFDDKSEYLISERAIELAQKEWDG